MIFKFCHNNLCDHVFLFIVVLLIFKVGHNILSGHVYVFYVVMTCFNPRHVNIKQLEHVNIIAT